MLDPNETTATAVAIEGTPERPVSKTLKSSVTNLY